MSEEITPKPVATVPQTPRAFIADGYTLPFSIPEIPGVSQSLSGTYRPFTPRAKSELFTFIRKHAEDAIKVDKACCEALQKHMVSWDLTADGTPDGTPVPITAQTLGMIFPTTLWNRMFEIVTGTASQDTTEALVIDIVRDATLEVDAQVKAIEKILEARQKLTIEAAQKNL